MSYSTVVLGLIVVSLAAYVFVSLRALRLEIKSLRESKEPKRLTHSMAAGLDDITAILMNVEQVIQQQELETNIAKLRLSHALEINRKMREGPHAYNPETPNRKGVTRHVNKTDL